jgi:hypothetical protein
VWSKRQILNPDLEEPGPTIRKPKAIQILRNRFQKDPISSPNLRKQIVQYLWLEKSQILIKTARDKKIDPLRGEAGLLFCIMNAAFIPIFSSVLL